MASIKDIKKRIGSVKNTQQTTRAMKMVSAAKLRRAQEAIQSQRPYAQRVRDLISELLSDADADQQHFMRKVSSQFDGPKRVLVLVVTSDRGLCGGFNSSVIKACQRWIHAEKDSGYSSEFVFVGRRGHDFFKHRSIQIAGYYPDLGGKVTFAKAKKLADVLVERFLKGDVDEVKIIYNEFKNAAMQRVLTENFLPLEASSPKVEKAGEASLDFIVKPSRVEVLRELLSKNFAIQMFRVLLESQAGEHGARMSAMENATKNAGEMIRKLTLQYNKQRQAGITKELLEIISGSESQKA